MVSGQTGGYRLIQGPDDAAAAAELTADVERDALPWMRAHQRLNSVPDALAGSREIDDIVRRSIASLLIGNVEQSVTDANELAEVVHQMPAQFYGIAMRLRALISAGGRLD